MKEVPGLSQDVLLIIGYAARQSSDMLSNRKSTK